MVNPGALGEFALGEAPDADAPLSQSNNFGLGALGEFALGEQGASDTGGDELGLATEADSAFDVTIERGVNVGLAEETDSAFAVTILRTYAVGLATETDSALAAEAFLSGRRRMVQAVARY